MRRGFAFVLTVFLCFQSLWLAAAPYCAHEADLTTVHVGHHTHEHAEQDMVDGASSDSSPATSHADCHVCHGAHGMAQQGAGVPSPDLTGRQYPTGPASWPAAPSAPPERPNWPRLA